MLCYYEAGAGAPEIGGLEFAKFTHDLEDMQWLSVVAKLLQAGYYTTRMVSTRKPSTSRKYLLFWIIPSQPARSPLRPGTGSIGAVEHQGLRR